MVNKHKHDLATSKPCRNPVERKHPSLRSRYASCVITEFLPSEAMPELGPLRRFYYHRMKCAGKEDTAAERACPLFIQNELHLLQTNAIAREEFMSRLGHLTLAPFARKQALVDRGLEELIEHWGPDAPAPVSTVFAVAAVLGLLQRRSSQSLGCGGGPPLHEGYGGGLGLGLGLGHRESLHQRERERPSLVVCRWINRHCPLRPFRLAWEEAGERPGERLRSQFQQDVELGVLQAAKTLYGERSFEWLRLLDFLPEHGAPQPLSASQCLKADGRQRLEASFRAHAARALQVQDHEEELQGVGGKQLLQRRLEKEIRGLCAYCPSILSLHELVRRVHGEHQHLMEMVNRAVLSRLRTMHFDEREAAALQAMISEGSQVGLSLSDDLAIALLQNQHHPSASFPDSRILGLVQQVTEDERTGVSRQAGDQLVTSVRRWLLRCYGRAPDRLERKEDKQTKAMSPSEYEAQKEEVRTAIEKAINGWYMVLSLPCFKQSEERSRPIMWEFSAAAFYRDPEAFLVLDCLLELEDKIQAVSSVGKLEQEIHRIACKAVRDAQEELEPEHPERLLDLLFERPTPFRYAIIETFLQFKQASSELCKVRSIEKGVAVKRGHAKEELPPQESGLRDSVSVHHRRRLSFITFTRTHGLP